MKRVMISSAANLSSLLAATALIAGCGGDGSGSTPTPTSNTPPQLAETVAITVNENVSGPVYTIAATDPDNDVLTFAIDGGPDADKFLLAANGALTFRISPDFEAATDLDRNNVYTVQIAVSDGKATSRQVVNVGIANLTAGDFRVRKVAGGFSNAIAIQPVMGDVSRVFVAERGGRVRLVNQSTGLVASAPFLDVSGEIATGGNRGLTGFAPAPDFAQSRIVYAAMTTDAGQMEVRRYRTLAGNPDQVDPTSADVIFRIASTDSKVTGGWIAFGTDDKLYIGTGDPTGTGEDRANLLGKILRVDVSGDAYPADPTRDYAIPADNPFAADASTPEIWVVGMANPYAGTFDPATGYLWISNYLRTSRSGNNFWVSEVNMVRAEDKGKSYHSVSLPLPDTHVLPMLRTDYGLAPPDRDRIFGPGLVYRGTVEQLQGRFIYAGVNSDAYRSINAVGIVQSKNDDYTFTPAQQGLSAATLPATGSGRDAAGNLYIANAAGDLFIVEPA